jgi:hypothetical protein
MSNDEDRLIAEAKEKDCREAKALLVLLERYKIKPTDNNCWFDLLLQLARTLPNWPNIKAKRGAPKGARTLAGKIRSGELKSLRDLILLTQGKTLPKKKRGAPKVRKVNWIDGIEAIKAEHHLKGHGSDKEAITIFVKRFAKPENMQSEIKKIQKLLSEQRKKIPTIPK